MWVYKYSIEIIQHCVIFLHALFDISALFYKNTIVICIRYKNWIYLYSFPCLCLLHNIMCMYATSLIVDTSKHGWTMVLVSMMTLSLVPSYFQYHFLLAFIILIYSAFTISSLAFMTGLSTAFSYCNVYGSDNNLKP